MRDNLLRLYDTGQQLLDRRIGFVDRINCCRGLMSNERLAEAKLNFWFGPEKVIGDEFPHGLSIDFFVTSLNAGAIREAAFDKRSKRMLQENLAGFLARQVQLWEEPEVSPVAKLTHVIEKA